MISDLSAFESWLEDKPPSWAYALTIRLAIRALPLVGEFFAISERGLIQEQAVIRTFRAAHVFWTAIHYPAFDMREVSIRAAASVESASYYEQTPGASAVAKSLAAAGRAYGDRNERISRTSVREKITSVKDSERVRRYATAAASACIGSGLEPSLIWVPMEQDIGQLLEIRRYYEEPVAQTRQLSQQRLWANETPSWAISKLNELIRSWSRLDSNSAIWGNWYASRIDARPSFGLPSMTAGGLDVQIASCGDVWWDRDPDKVNAELVAWINKARNDSVGTMTGEPQRLSTKYATDFIVQFLRERGAPATTTEIAKALSESGISIQKSSFHWTLTNLNSAKRIRRISRGLYASTEDSLTSQYINKIERQTRGAVQFEILDDRPIRVKRRASAGELRTDAPSRRRHAELVRRIEDLLGGYARSERGGNVLGPIIREVELLKESAGQTIEDVDPDLLIPRGDGLRNDIIAYDRRDDFSALPPVPDSLLLDLKKLVASYNNYIAFDPELAKRDEALLGPDVKKALVPPSAGQAVLMDAVATRAADAEVVDVLAEDARVAPEVPDPESRQSRRYSEGVKNFARAAIERAAELALAIWKGKVAIGSTVISVSTAAAAAAHWIIANKQWLDQYFSGNPIMLEIIEKLFQLLSKLPLA